MQKITAGITCNLQHIAEDRFELSEPEFGYDDSTIRMLLSLEKRGTPVLVVSEETDGYWNIKVDSYEIEGLSDKYLVPVPSRVMLTELEMHPQGGVPSYPPKPKLTSHIIHGADTDAIIDLPLEQVYMWCREGKWKQKDFMKWARLVRLIEPINKYSR